MREIITTRAVNVLLPLACHSHQKPPSAVFLQIQKQQGPQEQSPRGHPGILRCCEDGCDAASYSDKLSLNHYTGMFIFSCPCFTYPNKSLKSLTAVARVPCEFQLQMPNGGPGPHELLWWCLQMTGQVLDGWTDREWMNENQPCCFSHLLYELALINSIWGVKEVNTHGRN